MASSPIRIAYEGGGPVRCDLTAPPRSGDFAILADLRQDGYTDYVVYPVPFADSSFKALSLATKRRGGFDDEDLALFEAAIPALAFQSRGPGAAPDCAHPAGHIRRTAIRREGARRADSARHRRDHPSRDLAL